MKVVFNNPILYVVAYPGVDAIEVIDKRRGRGTLFSGQMAKHFQSELEDALSHGDDDDDIDVCLDQFEELLTQPAIYQ